MGGKSMTTMRAARTGARPARTNNRVALGLAALAVGVGLLYAPFAVGDRQVMQWTWPLGAVVLFFAIRTLGTAAANEFGSRQRAPREDAVARWLERLGGKAHVLRYVNVGSRSIEYVVVAPSGVFTIRTRNHRGRITERGGEILLNGRQLAPELLAASKNEAGELESRLASHGFGYTVHPLVVFTDALTDVRTVGEVTALPLRWLESFIRQSPGVMSPLETTLVAGALKRDSRATLTR